MNIVVFCFEKNRMTPYIQSLQNANFNLIEQGDEGAASMEAANAVVIDSSDQNAEDSLSYLCGLVLDIRKNLRVPLFIILKEAKQLDRRLLLQLGVTEVFDQLTEPSDFSLVVSNILTADYLGEEKKDTVQSKNDLVLIPENIAIRLEKDQETQLTRLEYKFLDYLQNTAGQTAGYEELVQAVWEKNIINGRSRIANIVFHLRKKIEKDPLSPKYLKTVRGKGYRLIKEYQ